MKFKKTNGFLCSDGTILLTKEGAREYELTRYFDDSYADGHKSPRTLAEYVMNHSQELIDILVDGKDEI
jgi:hypothetical protein